MNQLALSVRAPEISFAKLSAANGEDLEVLGALTSLCLSTGEMPTFTEVADHLRWNVTSVIRHLLRLRGFGYVEWDPDRSRSFRVLPRAFSAPQLPS